MPYLRYEEIKVGALVLYHSPRTLDTCICVIIKEFTELGHGEYGNFCEIMLPSGKVLQANRSYLRRVE